MADVKPLRLKSQKSKGKTTHTNFSDHLARVIVDTGLLHLDGYYDYLVPLELQEKVLPGTRLLVPFGTRTLEAIVFERVPMITSSGFKSIESVISPIPVFTDGVLKLILSCAERWSANPYDIVKAALPARVASVEKHFPKIDKRSDVARNKVRRVFYQFSPLENEFHSLSAMAVKAEKSGGVILLVPDERDVDELCEAFRILYPDTVYARLDSSLSRTDRYFNFLKIAQGEVPIIVGTRSAIFAPVANLQTIILHRDNSESYYHPRSPGWNARDVALIRSANESVSLVITGHSPSSEVARLIESKWLSATAKRVRLNVTSYAQQMGELLPNRIFAEIREALRHGPVLFLTPRKGYSASITCSKCRNEARCDCGGKLFKKSAGSSPQCAHCSKEFPLWKCNWCGGDRPHLLGRGSQRFAEELGRAFSGQSILSSEGDHILKDIPARPAIVISTPGSIPRVENGYSAVVVLQGNQFFSQPDMRSHERARAQIFQAASRVCSGGKIMLVIDSSHPITASIARWNPSLLSSRELVDRQEASLPPYYRSVQISSQPKEATSLIEGFKKSLTNKRLPATTRILGPALQTDGSVKILLLVDLRDAPLLLTFIHEFMRRRSVSKKPALKYRVDPYSLT